MKHAMGIVEALFDAAYLVTGLILGLVLIASLGGRTPARLLAGIMALVLVCGDAFHLVPRIRLALAHSPGIPNALQKALGRGKQITSITMTVFYLLLWHVGLMAYGSSNTAGWTALIYILAAIRVALCLLPQNKWGERQTPSLWNILRNIPFVLQGAIVTTLFCLGRDQVAGIRHMYLAIILSFAFYIPVVIWSNKAPKVGMLMLPKTCAYLWMLVMCLSL